MSIIDDEAPTVAPTASYQREERNRTITIRVSEAEYDRIDALARINENAVATECRIAILERVEQSKTDDAVRERAGRVYAEIDAEAAKERAKIDAILGTAASASAATATAESSEATNALDEDSEVVAPKSRTPKVRN